MFFQVLFGVFQNVHQVLDILQPRVLEYLFNDLVFATRVAVAVLIPQRATLAVGMSARNEGLGVLELLFAESTGDLQFHLFLGQLQMSLLFSYDLYIIVLLLKLGDVIFQSVDRGICARNLLNQFILAIQFILDFIQVLLNMC